MTARGIREFSPRAKSHDSRALERASLRKSTRHVICSLLPMEVKCMFTTRWRIFRLAGIPIYLDLSWLIILVLITWTLANVFASEVPRSTSST